MNREEMTPLHGNSHPSGNGSKATVKRVNWKKKAQQLERELEEAKTNCLKLSKMLGAAQVGKPSLAAREAKKLRRLEHIAARIINAPLCEECKRWVGQLYESEIKYTRETNGPQQAVGG